MEEIFFKILNIVIILFLLRLLIFFGSNIAKNDRGN